MELTSKPATLTTVHGTDKFYNGIGGSRYLRIHADGRRKRFYLNGMEYRIEDGKAKSVVYIRAKGYSPELYT